MSKVLNEYGLSVRDMEEIYRILKAHPEIALVHIFGSRAKGNYHSGSDIDLAIMNHGVDAQVIDRVLLELSESSFPLLVDLVDYNALSQPAFKDHIQRVGKVFYSSI